MSIVVSVEVVAEDSGPLEVIEAFKGIETNRERVIFGKQILYELPDSCTLILREVPVLSEITHQPGERRHGELPYDQGSPNPPNLDALMRCVKADLDAAQQTMPAGLIALMDRADQFAEDSVLRAKVYAEVANLFANLESAMILAR